MTERGSRPAGCIDPVKGGALEDYLQRRLDPEQEEAFEDHYFRCPSCLEEIELRQALPTALREAGVGRRRQGRWLAVASLAAGALLAYSSYLGFVELPKVQHRVGSLAGEVQELRGVVNDLEAYRERSRWSGAVTLVVLTGPARAERSEVATVTVRPGQPFVPLSAVPFLPTSADSQERYLFQIRGPNGGAVWQLEMHASEIRREPGTAPMVTFLVPAQVFTEGTHHLIQVATSARTSDPLWQDSFRIRMSQ